jgi:hypothetical protein
MVVPSGAPVMAGLGDGADFEAFIYPRILHE